MEEKNIYGTCECGGELFPVWFEEKEENIIDGYRVYTGRTRRACSHLECECGRKFCVDNSLDGVWEDGKT